jgi:hypothetical protein
MAVVPDKPVRIREYLADGTAHDVTVARYEEDDSIQVLDGEEAQDPGGTFLPPVYYSADQVKQLKTAKKSAAKPEEGSK